MTNAHHITTRSSKVTLAAVLAISVTAVAALGAGSASAAPTKTTSKQATVTKVMRAARHGARGPRGPRGLTGATGATGPAGATGAAGANGHDGAVAAWSASVYPHGLVPATTGELAHLTFESPSNGFVVVSSNFATRIKNATTGDCRTITQIAPTASVPVTDPTGQSAPGINDQWIPGNLPTQYNGGTYLGLSGGATRILPVVKGQNSIYPNGKTTCTVALWGPITITAMLVQQNPISTITPSS